MKMLVLGLLIILATLIGTAITVIYLDFKGYTFDKPGTAVSALVERDKMNPCRIYVITETRILGLRDRYLKAIVEDC